jgi:hypothetical protein
MAISTIYWPIFLVWNRPQTGAKAGDFCDLAVNEI